jgi:transketolase
LGSIVCDVLSEMRDVSIKKIGINDTFGLSGDYSELLDYFSLSPEKIATEIINVVNLRNSA